MSFLIVAAINFAVGTFALRLQSILGLMRAKFFLLELFSGLLLPMTFFPHIVQKILAVMPFEYISYVPMLIYLGKLNGGGLARAIAHAGFLGRGPAGDRRRPVALVNAESHHPGRIEEGRQVGKAKGKVQSAKA